MGGCCSLRDRGASTSMTPRRDVAVYYTPTNQPSKLLYRVYNFYNHNINNTFEINEISLLPLNETCRQDACRWRKNNWMMTRRTMNPLCLGAPFVRKRRSKQQQNTRENCVLSRRRWCVRAQWGRGTSTSQSPLGGAAVKTKKNNKSKFVLFLTL